MENCAIKDCTECSIETIEQEIKKCEFECTGGLLENHRGYVALLTRAKQLRSTIQNALVTLAVINMPVVGDASRVASDTILLKVMADSFKEALAETNNGTAGKGWGYK